MATYPLVLVRPPRHPWGVSRPRLTAWDGEHSATVLVGPAGSGKTVAAVQMATASGERIAWCRVGPGYGQAADVVAIAAASVDGPPPTAGDPLGLAGHLLELLEAEPTVLVIDDYHHADAASTDLVLAEVLPLVPPASRIVVTSRTRPAGLIGRVSPGLLLVIDADVLAFTDDEAASLFEAAGRPSDEARAWLGSTSGWAAALAVAAQSPGTTAGADLTALVERLVLEGLDGRARQLLDALSALPYLTGDLAQALGVGDGAALDALAQRTGVLADVGGQWRLHDVVRDAVRTVAGGGRDVGELRRRAADLLVVDDPEAAVEVLLDAGDHEAAASVLEARLSDVGVERAVGFVYRMPAPLRRRLPPLLTAGRATVDLDEASAAAAQRVQAAATEDEQAEALLALGSARAGAGDLGGAVEALEQVAARGGARGRLALAWLGIVRWWAGDLAGARAALGNAGDTVWACWARASVALVDDDLDGAAGWAARAIEGAAGGGATPAPGASVQALLLLLGGDVAGAEALATAAYEHGLAAGGFDLACGAASMAVLRAVQGRREEALAACELLERRVGRHDHHARLQAALVRQAVALAGGDTEERERATRRVRDLRRAGFAPVEQVAARLMPVLAAPPWPALRVELLGDGQVVVDGALRRGWRSHKALEALRFLAVAGDRGARREEVIEAIWPGREPDKGRTLLRTALSEIRRVLEPDRPAGEPSRFLETTGGRVVLRARTDVDDAAAADADEAFSILARPLVDIEGEWGEELTRDIARRRLDAAERVAAGGGPGAVGALEVLIEAEPWRRDLYDALIELHRAAGDDAAARTVERRWFEDED